MFALKRFANVRIHEDVAAYANMVSVTTHKLWSFARRHGAKILACMLIPVSWQAFPVNAGNDEWASLHAEAVTLLKQKRYEQSAVIERRALDIAEEKFGAGHPNVATSLNNLGKATLWQKRLAVGEPLIRRALAMQEVTLGPDHPDVAETLRNLALADVVGERPAQTEAHLVRALAIWEQELAIRESTLGRDHLDIAESLTNLADCYKYLDMLQQKQGRAEPLYQRALAIREKVFGSEHPDVANSLTDLADLYKLQDQYGKAEPLYQRALSIREKVFGSEHPDVANSLTDLAGAYEKQSQHGKAEPLYRRALAIREKIFGDDDPDVAKSLVDLADVVGIQRNVGTAESLYQRALAIREKAFGQESEQVTDTLEVLASFAHAANKFGQEESLLKRVINFQEKNAKQATPDFAYLLRRLGDAVRQQAKYEQTEPILKRAVAVWEDILSSNGGEKAIPTGWEWTYVDCLDALAEFYRLQGRFLEAEPIYLRALAIAETPAMANKPGMVGALSTLLNNLALLYDIEGQHAQAELIYKRVLATGTEGWIDTKNNLAYLYIADGRYALAEPLLKESLAYAEKSYGTGSMRVAPMLNNLGNLYRYQQRYELAEPLIQRSIDIREKALGHDHPDVALPLTNLGLLLRDQGRLSEAALILRRASEVRETALGPEHPDLAESLGYLANLYVSTGKLPDALEAFRRSTRILAMRIRTSAGSPALQRVTAESRGADTFAGHASLISKLVSVADTNEQPHLISEAFVTAQNAQAGDTGAALGQMAARATTRDDTLARKVREYQDAIAAWRQFDKQFIDAIGKPTDRRNTETERTLRQTLADTDVRITKIDAELLREFPDYQELVRPEPLDVANAQGLLKPDEALVSYLANEKELLIWVIRPGQAHMLRVDTTKVALSKQVATLRRRVDLAHGVLPYFSTAEAYALYETVFAPIAPYLGGVKHVMVVADGPLQSLPFGLLVTSPVVKKSKAPVPWLIRQFAFSNLPSVSSLRALRRFERGARAPEPFIGFGDPLLLGKSGQARNVSMSKVFARGALADIGEVRRLPRLPETAKELKAMAQSMGSTGDNVWLRNAATERRAKSVDLSRFRVVAFATHGLITGDFPGLAQPALVLTPPDIASEIDDGLLTASEISGLKLNADWVVLSACNTAAADGKPGAEGFSGLTKAFFYAGSKTLLVSHWAVDSKRTVALTSHLFAEAKGGVSPAEALRRAMIKLADDPRTAHPAFWAPFVVVGEGGTTL